MKRKRIKSKAIAPKDHLVFEGNCASNNARIIHKYTEFEIEIWIDKHYHNRRIFGDDDGKRKGIEEKDVLNSIIKAFKFLIDIYFRYPQFKFINYFEKGKATSKIRFVIQEFHSSGILNTVIEIHFLDVGKYEITIITAMEVDDFNISDGQYTLRLSSSKISLQKMINKNLKELYFVDLT